MARHRVLITSTFLKPGDEVDRRLREHGCETVHSPVHAQRTSGELIEALQGVEAVIAGSDRFTAEVLQAAPQLRLIARTGVGYDAVDVAAAKALDIAVSNAPGVNRASVAELTIGLMIMCRRRLPQNIADVRNGGWERLVGSELQGATLGIVGLGSIGQAVATLAQAFSMNVIAYDPRWNAQFANTHEVEPSSLDDLLTAADFVSLHIALTDETKHLINSAALGAMRRSAYLINTARGPIVDEHALADALSQGAIAGAALDVFEHEPLPSSSPLRDLDNVILTAHIGGSTQEARARSGMVAANCVIELLRDGIAANVVNSG